MNGILCAYLRATAPSTPSVRGDGVAAALDRELDDVLGIEVARVRGERRAGRVLDALVDRQDRDVAGAGQPAVVEERLQVAQDPSATGRSRPPSGRRNHAPAVPGPPWKSPGRYGPAVPRPRHPANPGYPSSSCLSGHSGIPEVKPRYLQPPTPCRPVHVLAGRCPTGRPPAVGHDNFARDIPIVPMSPRRGPGVLRRSAQRVTAGDADSVLAPATRAEAARLPRRLLLHGCLLGAWRARAPSPVTASWSARPGSWARSRCRGAPAASPAPPQYVKDGVPGTAPVCGSTGAHASSPRRSPGCREPGHRPHHGCEAGVVEWMGRAARRVRSNPRIRPLFV